MVNVVMKILEMEVGHWVIGMKSWILYSLVISKYSDKTIYLNGTFYFFLSTNAQFIGSLHPQKKKEAENEKILTWSPIKQPLGRTLLLGSWSSSSPDIHPAPACAYVEYAHTGQKSSGHVDTTCKSKRENKVRWPNKSAGNLPCK